MKRKVCLEGLFLVAAMTVLMTGISWGMSAMPVSPGDASGNALVGQSCPTFSWSLVDGAVSYRVEVYEQQTTEVLAHELMSAIAHPVRVRDIAAPALSWTPSVSECLATGLKYVWYVRGADKDAGGQWSEGKGFQVEATALSIEQRDAVCKAVKEYLTTEAAKTSLSGAAGSGSAAGVILTQSTGADGGKQGTVKGTAAVSAPNVPLAPSATAATTGLTIGGSGNVGINTTPSGFTLDVGGPINSTSNVSASTFSLPQTTGAATGVINLGSTLFMHGCCGSNRNTFVGGAGNFSTTGLDNTAIGFAALAGNTSADGNIAIGKGALNFNTNAGSNTAIGIYALHMNCYNVVGDCPAGYNTAVGAWAGTGSTGPLSGNVTGTYNTFIGANSGFDGPTNLTNATAIGANSQVTASNALVLGGTGQYAVNVGIGTTSPAYTLHINKNDAANSDWLQLGNRTLKGLALYDTGSGVDIESTGVTLFINFWGSQKTVLNASAAPTGYVGIGTANPDAMLTVNGGADKPGGGSWGTFSDARLKTLGNEFRAGLSEVLRLTPSYYRYSEQNALGIADRDEHVGFVAQEVEKVIPEAVSRNAQGYLLVNNDPILWAMLNAIKQQQALISEKDARIEKLERDNERVAKVLEKLALQVAVLEGSAKTVALK